MATRPRKIEILSDEDMPALAISPEKVCFVIFKAREFDSKDEVTEPDAGSNPSDDRMISVLEDHGDDPVVEELSSFISSLSEETTTRSRSGPALREEAARAHVSRAEQTASYLLGMPLLADYLEEGFSLFGQSCEDFEINRL
ncbi:MAG: DUF3775 domain-containing protein [Hyphomicrobiaceae bacterium]